tara:strand:- start:409 stop:645 length:237 start_codon:yes stop_codon:yes gene_type:complete
MDKFYDQFGGIGIVNGIAYIETLTLKDLPKTGEKAKFEKDGRMIMSVDTMLRLQNALKKVVDEMADKGIIVPKDKKKN